MKWWYVFVAALVGLQTGIVVPSFRVTLKKLVEAQAPGTVAGSVGSQNRKRPCGVPELPASRPALGSGKPDCDHLDELISFCL